MSAPAVNRRRPGPGILAVPAAAVLGFLATLTSVDGLHQAAGAALVVLLGWTVYGVLTRLFPGLDAAPAVVLASVVGLALIILAVVIMTAATVSITPRPMVEMVAGLAAATSIGGELVGRSRMPTRFWRSRRTVTIAVLTVAACGLLVTDAGALTARLAPRAVPAPYTSFSFAGPAARWSQELSVTDGQVINVPLQVVNHGAHRDRFSLSYVAGGNPQPLATVELSAGQQYTATFPVTLPTAGCPSRLAFYSHSSTSTEMLDVWLQWNDPACA